MPKNLLTTLGALIASMPFISIPGAIKDPLYIVFGAMIAVISYREKHAKRKGFIGNVVRRGRKVVSQISPTSTIGSEMVNSEEALQINNEQTGVPTN